MKLDTAELVRAAQNEAPGALDQLIEVWLPVVLGWCMRLANSSVQAEDAAQDAIEAMIYSLDGLRDPVAFPAWLYQITRRVLKRHARRAWLRKWVPGADVPEHADTSVDPLRLVGQSEVVTRVRAAIAELPLHQREVVVLCDLEERPDSEVAAILGVPKGTVKSRLRRARIALRDRVSDIEGWGDMEATG
jgi:RNA polymerase sigma-70 factor (ECF subfamily)